MRSTSSNTSQRSIRLLAQTAALLAFILTFTSPAHADTLQYNVSIDTSSLPVGDLYQYFLDLQFNPGQLPGTQLAYAETTVPDCCVNFGIGLTGDVSDGFGGGPTQITYDNQTPYNDAQIGGLYFTAHTPITFGLTIFGPAVDSPDGTSVSGSIFAISLLDANFAPILTSNPNGVLGLVNLNTDGTGTVQTFSSAITITDLNPPPPPAVPEPNTLVLLGTGLAGTLTLVRRRVTT